MNQKRARSRRSTDDGGGLRTVRSRPTSFDLTADDYEDVSMLASEVLNELNNGGGRSSHSTKRDSLIILDDGEIIDLEEQRFLELQDEESRQCARELEEQEKQRVAMEQRDRELAVSLSQEDDCIFVQENKHSPKANTKGLGISIPEDEENEDDTMLSRLSQEVTVCSASEDGLSVARNGRPTQTGAEIWASPTKRSSPNHAFESTSGTSSVPQSLLNFEVDSYREDSRTAQTYNPFVRPSRLPPPVSSMQCPLCRGDFGVEAMFFMEACNHPFCTECLKSYIAKQDRKQLTKATCPLPSCTAQIIHRDLKVFISSEEYEQVTLLATEEFLRSSNEYVKCPAPGCDFVLSRALPSSSALDTSIAAALAAGEKGPDGTPLTAEAIRHREMHRFRCRVCNTDFCATCKATPYHLCYTCEQFEAYKSAKHCRYCNAALEPPANRGRRKAETDSCQLAECESKRKLSCTRSLPCGHRCYGISHEQQHPPCLHLDCASRSRSSLTQSGDDFCNICWTEGLCNAPCIILSCGHAFHFSCTSDRLKKRWTGVRIVFTFLNCPLCNGKMDHPSLRDLIGPIDQLQAKIKDMAAERLQFEDLLKCKEVTDPQSRFHNDPASYAMHRYAYFPCYKCQKPYFAGQAGCMAGAQMEVLDESTRKDMLCGACSSNGTQDKCPKHGADYIEYKCKFCCNVASFFCW
eukprot:CAMPEP_0184650452 /NCGR_PEP_ID=MMETSP0308-20130426/7975_1 /TAXON_ID=38269 /ORGANISM="Gloeochaete witrockiana, Strain SAG 46.84" /LENGTH=691 /DNA_ID=CAMNT_0027083973 /DNA_START=100 /DNA_END=2172 /DNA_ORIENTATION=+